MEPGKKKARYERLNKQIEGLISKPGNQESRLSTVVAVLHHHFQDFFWTGFYLLKEGELIVQTYQGPLACQLLEKNQGVCWAAINEQKTIIVPDVHNFPGHIACDPRSSSEIAVPLRDRNGVILGVLDIDSAKLNSFDETDGRELEKILELIAA